MAESLNELEDQDLDTLVTDLKSESTADADNADNGDVAGEDTTLAASQESEAAAKLPPALTGGETPQHTVKPSENQTQNKLY